ncbi:nuclease-related domain-containing protein [Streptomyces sp. NPDC087294]|uniref:nuclease-related domain-containing protein n=1 Tax=Streptomyces sp. NPDC087294 TaxID=3365777 RepID=UPI00382E1223
MLLNTPSPGDPGASAQCKADELRRDELRFQHHRALSRLLPVLLAWAAAAAGLTMFLIPLPGSIAITALIPLKVFRRLYEPGDDVQRWRAGAAGERRTAGYLRPLTQRGWVILHDRATYGHGNLDHVALTPDGQGAVCINTKTTRGGGEARFKGNDLILGRTSYHDTVKKVLREAENASRALQVPVQAVIAVHGARVKGGRIVHPNGLVIVNASQLRPALTSVPHQRDPQRLDRLTRRAEYTLPAYDLTPR